LPGASLNNDASIKYWNEVWLDELIDEAFRLIKEKAAQEKGAGTHPEATSMCDIKYSTLKR